jgi:hypothetical protein
MVPIVALALALASTAPLAAAGPDPVGTAFDVKVSGGVVDVTFALALSDVSTYPVTITAVSGSTEEVLYDGTLPEGIYRFSAPLKKISGQGELRVILRTKVTSRSDRGSGSFLVYRRWQGSM